MNIFAQKLFKIAAAKKVSYRFFPLNSLHLNVFLPPHDRVRESVKNALSRTLLHLVFKIFKKKNFTHIKSDFVNNLIFFTNKCTHLLKTSNFEPQGPQMQRYSSVTLHVSPKNPISAKKKKITFSKIQILAKFFFFWVVWSKTN